MSIYWIFLILFVATAILSVGAIVFQTLSLRQIHRDILERRDRVNGEMDSFLISSDPFPGMSGERILINDAQFHRVAAAAILILDVAVFAVVNLFLI